MKEKKQIAPFTIAVCGLLVIAYCIYWFLRFYQFLPAEGTSTASISALWGQFVVSLIFIVAVVFALIRIDNRPDVRLNKLLSFWLVLLVILSVSGYIGYEYYFDKTAKSKSNKVYGFDEPFEYNMLKYSLTKSSSDIFHVSLDCSLYVAPSGKLRLYTQEDCEETNDNNKKESEESTFLLIDIDVRNDSSSPQDTICKECLILKNSRGDIISQEISFESQAFSRQIFPGNSVSMQIKYKVKKSELNDTYYLAFTTNSGTRYIKIN